MVVFFDNKPPIRLHPLATHVVSVVEEESSKKNPICVGTRIRGRVEIRRARDFQERV